MSARSSAAAGPVAHPLAPVWDAESRVLILGTLPSPASRQAGFYYMHPQNRFWPVLAALFDQPVPQGPEARRAFALVHRIALWDTLASCTIAGASDASIQDPVPNDLGPILAGAPIRAVFTTGAAADRFYRRFQYPRTGLAAHRLPSPSAANCATPFDRLVREYTAILPFLQP